MMNQSRIGYRSGVAWARYSSPPTEEADANFFITGFIPYEPANSGSGGALTCRYSDGNYYNANRHYLVFYDTNKEFLRATAYYDMSQSSGIRSVTFSSAWLVDGTKYIRFSGYLPDINECYVYDDKSNIYLWKKGM